MARKGVSKNRRHSGSALTRTIRIIGLILLIPGFVSALLLALDEFRVLELREPVNGVCLHSVARDWHSVLNWPISFVALAYIAAAFAVWTNQRGHLSPSSRYFIRFGAFFSACCGLIALGSQQVCLYWLTIHGGNVILWLFAEVAGADSKRTSLDSRYASSSIRAGVTLAAAFALVSAGLNVAKTEQDRRIARQRHQREKHTDVPLGAQVNIHSSVSRQTETKPSGETAEAPREITRANADERPKEAFRPYRLGMEQAPIKLVLYIDYECEQSVRLEKTVLELFRRHDRLLSISVRHYPRCTDCNYSQPTNVHPNACQAAKVAETAGILKGSSGFWQMHLWLVERHGSFTTEELRTGLRQLGYGDFDKFVATMASNQTLRNILTDIVEAESLSVKETPGLFINGMQTQGDPEKALLLAVHALIKKPLGPQASRKDWVPAIASADPDSGAFSKEVQASAITATVQIVNSSRESAGSGVILSTGPPFVYILTAHHVATGEGPLEIQTFSSESYPRPSRIYPNAQVIAFSAEADLAVVRVFTGDTSLSSLPLCPLSEIPSIDGFSVLSAGCTDEDAPTCRIDRVVARKIVRKESGKEATFVWELSKEIANGRSGGPLIDKQGRILGLASGRSQGRGYYCHIREIHNFLASSAVQWLLDEAAQPSSN